MTIYEIDHLIEELFDPETGELVDGAEEKLEELSMARRDKVRNIALAYKNARGFANAVRDEVRTLQQRHKVAENRASSLLNLLNYATGGEDFNFPDVAVKTRRNPESVEVVDLDACINYLENTGRHYCIVHHAPDVSKSELKFLLKNGEVPGAKLVRTTRTEVK